MPKKFKFLFKGLAVIVGLVMVLGAVGSAQAAHTVTASPSSVTLDDGNSTAAISVSVIADGAIAGVNLTAVSDDTTVATVSPSFRSVDLAHEASGSYGFRITGRSAGSAIITFSIEGITADVDVTSSVTTSPGGDLIPRYSVKEIGGTCYQKEDCDPVLNLTCNTELQKCVGQNGADCSTSGLAAGMEEGERCEVPLICKPSVEGDFATAFCTQYFGSDIAKEFQLGETTRDIRDTARQFINIFLSFLGIIGVVIVIYGGMIWMTARGNDEQVEKAKKTLVSGIVGIIIVAIAWTITSYVLKLGQQVG